MRGCFKFVAFVFNFMYFVAGGFFVGLGIWVLVDLPDVLIFFGYGALVVGGVVVVASCFGFTSFTNSNKCLLILYIISCVVVVAPQAYAVYKCFNLSPKEFEETVYHGLDKSFKNDKKMYHKLEKLFQCCGVNKTAGGDYPSERIPKVCCKENIQGKSCDPSHIWPSCTRVITDYTVKYARAYGYIMTAACGFQVVMIITACILMSYGQTPHGHH